MLTVVLAALASTAMPSHAQDATQPTAKADLELGFSQAFPRKFYEKKYFGVALTGATVVAAGAFTFYTAGAGAPTAAMGVSTVASWVAGGGAGSYMAGLSTIGGWFGGNAILGASILNGISIGVTGGGAAFATLPAAGKAAVIASISATALDGIALVGNPETREISHRVLLPVPIALGSGEVRNLAEKLEKLSVKQLEREDEILSQEKKATTKELKEEERRTAAAKAEKLRREQAKDRTDSDSVVKEIIARGKSALKSGESNRNLVLLAVLVHNLGQPDLYSSLLDKVQAERLMDAGYVEYLRAVALVERGQLSQAERRLRISWDMNGYAIEAPSMLVIVLGTRAYAQNDREIEAIAKRADGAFDDDKYASPFSLVTLHYRIATSALQGKRCDRALAHYEQAKARLSTIQKYVTGHDITRLLDLGIANALYCQGKNEEANAKFTKVIRRVKDKSESDLVYDQYAGGRR